MFFGEAPSGWGRPEMTPEDRALEAELSPQHPPQFSQPPTRLTHELMQAGIADVATTLLRRLGAHTLAGRLSTPVETSPAPQPPQAQGPQA